MSQAKKVAERYVVCVRTDGGLDLEPQKVYRVLPDPQAAEDSYLRIVDESGEDYLYPSSFFVAVEVSEESAHALRRLSRTRSRSAS